MNISFLIFLFFLLIKWRKNKSENESENLQYLDDNQLNEQVEQKMVSDTNNDDFFSYCEELDDVEVKKSVADKNKTLTGETNCLTKNTSEYNELDYDVFDDDTIEIDSEKIIEVERIDMIGKESINHHQKKGVKSLNPKKAMIYKELLEKPKGLRR